MKPPHAPLIIPKHPEHLSEDAFKKAYGSVDDFRMIVEDALCDAIRLLNSARETDPNSPLCITLADSVDGLLEALDALRSSEVP